MTITISTEAGVRLLTVDKGDEHEVTEILAYLEKKGTLQQVGNFNPLIHNDPAHRPAYSVKQAYVSEDFHYRNR